MTTDTARTAVLLTCYNRKQVTLQCIDHLLDGQLWQPATLDVYLVDDASPDDTGAAVKERFPQVNIINGDGKRYWCGGMRLAWQEAAKGDYDAYIWLNDDTFLEANALEQAFETLERSRHHDDSPIIVAGSVRDPDTGEITYGGITWKNRWGRIKSGLATPTGYPQPCDTMNGNFVLVSKSAFLRVGNLSDKFIHGMGDFDYGLRARASGCAIWATGEYIGECSRQRTEVQWFDPSLSFFERLQKLSQPTGLPPREYSYFNRQHGGQLWMLNVLKLYARLLFPSFWRLAKAARRQAGGEGISTSGARPRAD